MTEVTGARDLSALLEFATGIAHQAGVATLRFFGDRLSSDTKADGTPVTRADRAAEKALRQAIRERFAEDGILGEEFGEEKPGSAFRWILDPIDGTRSFVHGVPLYSVLVGLQAEGEPVLGVIHFPALGDTIAAARGQGCHLNGVACRVNDTASLAGALALTSDPRFTARSAIGDGWERLCGEVDTVRGWGDAYGHMLVATGRADIMVDPELEVWDAAPLLPILEEAGGRFTSVTGEATIEARSGVSTNGRLHDTVLDRLGTALR